MLLSAFLQNDFTSAEKGLQFFMTADNNDERHALSRGLSCNIFFPFGLTFLFCHGYGQ